jgi:thiol-disulfide isomerase/thioredoxin
MNRKLVPVFTALLLAVIITAAVIAYENFSGRVSDELIAQAGLVTGAASIHSESEGTESASANDGRIAAPDIVLLDINGNEVYLSDFFGMPIVVNFWASWCPPCRVEMPDFENVYLDIGDEIKFVMVNLVGSNGETIESASAFIEQGGYTFPVYFDMQNQAGMVYGVRAIPTTLYIDRDGYVIGMRQGAIIESTLRRDIELIK